MPTSTPWAIVLCKFSEIPSEPQPPSFFEQLFCQQGAGMGGLLDYWQEISYGAVDLSGSHVYGWFSLDHTFADDKKLTRLERITKGIQTAQANGVNLSSYFGIVVILNAPDIDQGSVGRVQLDLGAGTKAYGLVVLDPLAWNASVAAHEMGHGFGLRHARSAPPYAPEAVYGDLYDVMGGNGGDGYWYTSPDFVKAGPGLNAAYLTELGWLPQTRVVAVDVNTSNHEAVDLARLENPTTPGALAARVDVVSAGSAETYSYLIEYRQKDGWDVAIPNDAVLVHEVRPDGISYLVAALTSPDEEYINSQFDFGVVLDDILANPATARIYIGGAPAVKLIGDVETLASKTAGKGEYHYPGSKLCNAADFKYVRELRSQRAQYWADADLFDPPPTTFEWRLNDTPLDPAATNVVLPVTSRSALPPPSGKLTYGHDAVIEYDFTSISSIELANRPQDATYSVTLRVVATNSAGQTASAELTIEFEGDVLVFERGYYAYMHRCLMRTRAFISKLKTKPKKRPKGGDPGPVKTAKRKLAQAVREIIQEEPRLADEMEEHFGDLVRLRGGLPPGKGRIASSPKSKHL